MLDHKKKAVIIVPARLSAKRLPNKPILLVNSIPLIVRVLELAKKSDVQDIILTSPDQEILDLVKNHSYQTVKTDENCKTGSDRIFQAYKKSNINNVDFIVNLQGDMIHFDPKIIDAGISAFSENFDDYDIATLVVEVDYECAKNDSIVKTVVANKQQKKTDPSLGQASSQALGQALYFSRSLVPFYKDAKNNMYYKHLGIYIFKPAALEKFVAYPQSKLEKAENLEQLRALENGMKILCVKVASEALSIDTKEDLIYTEKILAKGKNLN